MLRAALLTLAWACTGRAQESERPVVAPPPASARQRPTPPPYGFWGLNGHLHPEGLEDLKRRFGLSVFHTATTDPADATTRLLPMARAAGLKVTLRLTGSHERYTTPGGDFDLGAWKAMLERWEPEALSPFIEDGTLFGHMILDDIYNFEGRDPSAADLDEMARLSRERFPGLLTFVREEASELPPPEGGRYRHLDASVNQYRAVEGDVTAYAARESTRSKALGIGMINGLNIANGGDGSSGQPGWQEGRFAMSAAEITAYGSVLATTPGCGMFLNWEYDGLERWSDGSVGSRYFDRPELQAALQELGALVARQPAVSLHRP